MRIAIVSHLKYPIAKPFAGGLEAFTYRYVHALQQRGHDVTLFAAGDSDEGLNLRPVVARSTVADCQRRVGRIDHVWIDEVENEAYERMCDALVNSGQHQFDIVHNHSLSPIPLRFARSMSCQMVTTLHAPCLPRMERELRSGPPGTFGSMVNISRANAEVWQHATGHQRVIHNGVDTHFWKNCPPAEQPRAIWFGRILPVKGTHLAIEAAHRAGLPIDIVGPVADQHYFRTEVQPRLTRNDANLGHRSHEELCHFIGRASVALATPCWDEPFGLVVAEALACGTPVAGFSRGALREIIRPSVGRLVKPGHVGDLANAIRRCIELNGNVCRRYAQEHFSEDRMVSDYIEFYKELIHDRSLTSIHLSQPLPASKPRSKVTSNELSGRLDSSRTPH